MANISYITGNLAYPNSSTPGMHLIIHGCNDSNRWGAGISGALSGRWKSVELEYRKWFNSNEGNAPAELGNIQMVQVEPNICVFNMITQHGIAYPGTQPGVVPFRPRALDACLEKLATVIETMVKSEPVTVHSSQIGSNLARGEWEDTELRIHQSLGHLPIDVFIYIFSGK